MAWADSSALEISEETLLFTAQFTVIDEAEADSTDIGLDILSYAIDDETLGDADSITVSTGTATSTVTLKGDANGDGAVDIDYVTLIMRHLTGYENINYSNTIN